MSRLYYFIGGFIIWIGACILGGYLWNNWWVMIMLAGLTGGPVVMLESQLPKVQT